MRESGKTYPRILSILLEHPWAITPSALELLVEIVERRIEGREPSAEDKAVAIEAARRQATPIASPGATAVIPIYGVISHRAHTVQDVSSTGTSSELLLRSFRSAIENPAVTSVVFDIDSPGGSVFGIQELADEIAAARGSKPIVAVANSQAGSAAYWIAGSADEIVVTPSGMVGAVGVIAMHQDRSKAAEAEGVKRTIISAGRFKAEGNPYEPLSDEARAELQKSLDLYHDTFVKSLARGRKVSQTAVRETFGEGRMVHAAAAVERGMADRIETLDQTIARLQGRSARASGARAEEVAPEIEAAPAGDRELELARARLDLAGIRA